VAEEALPPNFSFGPSELCKLGRAERGFADGKELVELWRWKPRTCEHRVRLTAVMDLVLEEMQQQAVGAFGLHSILNSAPGSLGYRSMSRATAACRAVRSACKPVPPPAG
jgi:hypothetical protein